MDHKLVHPIRRPTAIIADDNAGAQSLLRRVLETEFEVVDMVVNGMELFRSALRLHPALIVVDVLMPVLSGIEAVMRLNEQSLTSAVVFISTDGGEENVRLAFRTGAQSFVRKASAAEDLLPAAQAALHGRRFVSGAMN